MRIWIPWSLLVVLAALATASAVVGATTHRGESIHGDRVSPFYLPAGTLRTVPRSVPTTLPPEAGYRGIENFCAVAPLSGTVHYDGTSGGAHRGSHGKRERPAAQRRGQRQLVERSRSSARDRFIRDRLPGDPYSVVRRCRAPRRGPRSGDRSHGCECSQSFLGTSRTLLIQVPGHQPDPASRAPERREGATLKLEANLEG